jgi:hypothetical protein
MGFVRFVVAAALAFVVGPLSGQQDSGTPAVTRVSAPLRESPDVEARAFLVIPPKTVVAVTACKDGWCAVGYHGFAGHVVQVFLRFPAPPSLASGSPSSTRGYINSQGDWVPSPTRTPDGQPPSGASAQCRDGTYSFSRSRRGTCSHHGGVSRWL